MCTAVVRSLTGMGWMENTTEELGERPMELRRFILIVFIQILSCDTRESCV